MKSKKEKQQVAYNNLFKRMRELYNQSRWYSDNVTELKISLGADMGWDRDLNHRISQYERMIEYNKKQITRINLEMGILYELGCR